VTFTEPARAPRRGRIRWTRVAVLAAAVAAVIAALGDHGPASTSTATATHEHRTRTTGTVDLTLPTPPSASDRPLGQADGAIPDGTTVFDDVPGVARLDPALLAAIRQAANDAATAGIRFSVDSGWRSRAYQAHLLDDAIAKYGSREEASRWVATPDTSEHVSGNAIDVGPADADAWLDEHGAAYGLCRIYDNEPWHFELRPDAARQGCPPRYADAAHDPRMQR
jgi:hypothetical protein